MGEIAKTRLLIIMSVLFCLVVVCSCITFLLPKASYPSTTTPQNASGTLITGEYNYEGQSYVIDSVADWLMFSQQCNSENFDFLGKTVYLAADLDLTCCTNTVGALVSVYRDAGWVNLGNSSYPEYVFQGANYFNGALNGQGFTLSNYTNTATPPSGACIGLFAYLKNVSITNLNLYNFNVSNGGALCGESIDCIFENINIDTTSSRIFDIYTNTICRNFNVSNMTNSFVTSYGSGSFFNATFTNCSFTTGALSRGGCCSLIFQSFSGTIKGVIVDNCKLTLTLGSGFSASDQFYFGFIAGRVLNSPLEDCIVKNSQLISGGISSPGYTYGGFLVGFANGSINNCKSINNTTTIKMVTYFGGIVGYGNRVNNSINTSSFVTNSCVGGIIGYTTYDSPSNTKSINCMNTGNINGSYAGGIVGILNGPVANCLNTGTITASNAGGILGSGVNDASRIASNCLNVATVTRYGIGSTLVTNCASTGTSGQLISNCTITNCYTYTPSTDNVLRSYDTFPLKSSWDFVDTWCYLSSGYYCEYLPNNFPYPVPKAFCQSALVVTFNANGGSGDLEYGSYQVVEGEGFTLPNYTGTKGGAYFDGWSSTVTTTDMPYAVGTTFIPTENITLYANWATTWTTTFDNSEAVSPDPITVNIGESFALPTFTGNIINKKCIGWNTKKDGTGTTYNFGYNYTPTASTIMYPIWSYSILVNKENDDCITINSYERINISATSAIVTASYTDDYYPKFKINESGYAFIKEGSGGGNLGNFVYRYIYENNILRLTIGNIPSGTVAQINLGIIEKSNVLLNNFVNITFNNGTGSQKLTYNETNNSAQAIIVPENGKFLNSITVEQQLAYQPLYTTETLPRDSNASQIVFMGNNYSSRITLYFYDLWGTINITINLSTEQIVTLQTPKVIGSNYTYSINSEPGGEARVVGASDDDQNVTLVAVPYRGYYFAYWSVDDGDTPLTNESSQSYTSSASVPKDDIMGYVVTAVFLPDPSNSGNPNGRELKEIMIESAAQLYALSQLSRAGETFSEYTIYLTADIDMSEYSTKWVALGTAEGSDFDGRFIAQGYTITNLEELIHNQTVTAMIDEDLLGIVNTKETISAR